MTISLTSIDRLENQFLNYKKINARFIIVMISLALLERYLREKSGVTEGKLNARFRAEMMKLFPVIASDDIAKIFWAVCRNGLMHQATFRTTWGGKNVTMGLLESAAEIEHRYGSSGDTFMISPTKFSIRVIEVIEITVIICCQENSCLCCPMFLCCRSCE